MEVFNLNIRPGKAAPVIHCSQFDKGRQFRANLFDGTEVYTLTGAETLSIIEKKEDGNMVTVGVVNTSDSYVEFFTTEQMTALAGPQMCELRIVEGDDLIGTANFLLDCEESPDTGIESDSAIHNLETQIAEIDAEIVPPIVAEEVANQYDSENVIFDDTPTESHGTGYTVTSEGIKAYVDNKPNALVDLTDVDIDNPTSNQALVWNPDEQKWINGEVSTVGGLNDLNDVTITNVADKQELVYDDTDDVFKNKTTRVELTQAEYDALPEPEADVDYYITDAPSMQGSAKELSYDGGTDSVYDVVEEVKGDVADNASDITALQTGKCNLLKVVRKWRDVTFDNYYTSYTLDISETGYTPIGVVGFQTNTVGAQFFRLNLDATNNLLMAGLVTRDGTSPLSGTISTYADILYVKNT